jgi:hypothetical protein
MCLKIATASKLVSCALALATLGGTSPAFADEGSCAAVRHTRMLAQRRGLDTSVIEELERIECGGGEVGGFRGGRRPPQWRGGFAPDDDEFQNTVMRAIRQAASSDEPNVCRYYARITAVTSEQVRMVIQAVSSRNEAACALAFFPRVVDPMRWDRVYGPMSASAEREVREALGR